MAAQDFRLVIDYSAFAAFEATDFESFMDAQALTLLTGDAVLEVSWNGSDVHKVMRPGEVDSAMSWDDHPRQKVWLKKQSGTSGTVEIVAYREAGRE